jgi:hypothetical protein
VLACRYDIESLRSLVILEPRWVIDAACCFIRDYERADHTIEWERMKSRDAEAAEKEPEVPD